MLANGTVYPEVTVEARRYRVRILNACNARFLNLQLYVDERHRRRHHPGPADPQPRQPPTVQGSATFTAVIGTEGGFLPKPVTVPVQYALQPAADLSTGSLILAPAERADCHRGLHRICRAQRLILYTDAPAPFPVGAPNDYFPG